MQALTSVRSGITYATQPPHTLRRQQSFRSHQPTFGTGRPASNTLLTIALFATAFSTWLLPLMGSSPPVDAAKPTTPTAKTPNVQITPVQVINSFNKEITALPAKLSDCSFMAIPPDPSDKDPFLVQGWSFSNEQGTRYQFLLVDNNDENTTDSWLIKTENGSQTSTLWRLKSEIKGNAYTLAYATDYDSTLSPQQALKHAQQWTQKDFDKRQRDAMLKGVQTVLIALFSSL